MFAKKDVRDWERNLKHQLKRTKEGWVTACHAHDKRVAASRTVADPPRAVPTPTNSRGHSKERSKYKRMDWEAQIRKDMLIHVMRKNEKDVRARRGWLWRGGG